MWMMSGFFAALAVGIMSSSAFSVRICASSKMMTSTAAKPRPKPCSRAPNRMRLPLANAISSCPLVCRMALQCLARPGRLTSACIDLNVSAEVRVRCAVQMTLRFGAVRHRMTMIVPTVKVLPVCRQIDMPMPPTLEA